MEYIDGIPLLDTTRLAAAGYDFEEIGEKDSGQLCLTDS